MNNGFIGIFDSGVGGLSVLKKLTAAFPCENFLYLGDNFNAPYGNKSERELLSLALNNLIYLLSFGVKAIVVACNTISVTLFDEINNFSPVPVFGVFPPVEIAELSGRKTLLLATKMTAERYAGLLNVRAEGLPYLAEDIERNIFNLGSIDIGRHLNVLNIKKGEFETVILGCTHYAFVKSKIIDHLKPLEIYDSADATVKSMAKYEFLSKSSVKYYKNKINFIGKSAKINKCFWEKAVENSCF